MTSVIIQFYTPDDVFGTQDDKDWNTHVRVDLCTIRNEIVAYLDSNLGGSQDLDHQYSYRLQVNGPWFTKSRIEQGYIHLRIDTVGSDSWLFTFALYLKYSDGGTTRCVIYTSINGGYKLSGDSDNRTRYFDIDGVNAEPADVPGLPKYTSP